MIFFLVHSLNYCDRFNDHKFIFLLLSCELIYCCCTDLAVWWKHRVGSLLQGRACLQEPHAVRVWQNQSQDTDHFNCECYLLINHFLLLIYNFNITNFLFRIPSLCPMQTIAELHACCGSVVGSGVSRLLLHERADNTRVSNWRHFTTAGLQGTTQMPQFQMVPRKRCNRSPGKISCTASEHRMGRGWTIIFKIFYYYWSFFIILYYVLTLFVALIT